MFFSTQELGKSIPIAPTVDSWKEGLGLMADLDGKSEDRVVLFLGSSSAGTSLVIDELASPPGDEDDVTTSDIDESLEASSHIVSRGPLEMRYTKFDGSKSSTRMVFTGSPGLPDASGLGVSFLDEIMEHVKQHPPHGIVFVLRADCQYTPDLKYALMAMKECFNNMLSESRLLVYVTNLPSLSTLLEEGIEEDEEQVKRQEELARDVANHVVHYALGPDHLEGFQNFIGPGLANRRRPWHDMLTWHILWSRVTSAQI